MEAPELGDEIRQTLENSGQRGKGRTAAKLALTKFNDIFELDAGVIITKS